MSSPRLAAIVLAAGFSSRMEEFKPLLTVNEETITDRVISLFRENDIPVYLITGWRQKELLAGIRHHSVTVIENPDYARGMFTSVQSGVRSLPAVDGFFVLPVDIPLIKPFTVKCLVQAAARNPGKILYPVFSGTRGHPTLVPSGLIPEILGWQKDGGLKAVLDSHPDLALEIKVPDRNMLYDIDTPEDYKAMLSRLERDNIPSAEECEVILTDIYKMPEDRYRHCRKVADLAVEIGQALVAAGQKLDLEIIRSAAVLHDIAKGQPKHDVAGGKMLAEMGFSVVADIVAVHTDLPQFNPKASLEAKIVYLADKFIKGVTPVSLEERYSTEERPFAVTRDIKTNITRRKMGAIKVKHEIEALLGFPLEKLIFK
jgi:molybdenum cofactor cytidylyltransferase